MLLGDHYQPRIWAYVVPDQSYDVILGLPWMKGQGVVKNARKGKLVIQSSGSTVYSIGREKGLGTSPKPIIVNAVSFAWLSKQRDVEVFAASLADIEKTRP